MELGRCANCAQYYRGKPPRQAGLRPQVSLTPWSKVSVDSTGTPPRLRVRAATIALRSDKRNVIQCDTVKKFDTIPGGRHRGSTATETVVGYSRTAGGRFVPPSRVGRGAKDTTGVDGLTSGGQRLDENDYNTGSFMNSLNIYIASY